MEKYSDKPSPHPSIIRLQCQLIEILINDQAIQKLCTYVVLDLLKD